mmetsp:Transcript_13179/g.40578  ORF Transcript_13179/g.40578 Transcript_13179/m.40578 type:complete len:105 (-) Transcript_13179:406-720(-)
MGSGGRALRARKRRARSHAAQEAKRRPSAAARRNTERRPAALTHCRAVRRQRGDAFVLSSRLAAARRAAPRRPPCYADGEKESSKTRSGHRRERDRESGSVVRR